MSTALNNTVMHTEINAQGEDSSTNCEQPYKSDIVRAWKTECRLTEQQKQLFMKWCAARRRVFNWALEERIKNYELINTTQHKDEEPPKRLSRFDQTKALTALIHNGDVLNIRDIPSALREFAVQDVDLAFQAFFRKLKARQTPMRKGAKRTLAKEFGAPENWPELNGVELWSKLQGWPRFKSCRDFQQAFRIRGSLKSYGDSVKIPLIKEPIRLKEKIYFPIVDAKEINTATVSFCGGKWYLSLNADWQIELGCSVSEERCCIYFDEHNRCVIKVDSGAEERHEFPQPGPETVATAAAGSIEIPAASPYRAELKRIRRLSREFSRRAYDSETKRESNRRAKTRLKLQKMHAKIERRRKYFLHELSTSIVQRFGYIKVIRPDLKLAQKADAMQAADAAWGEFLRQLKYKSDWNGSTYEEQVAGYKDL